MMAGVYYINKGVSKPIVVKGLKAQYIAYLAVGLVFLLMGFVLGYIAGVPLFVLLPLVLALGSALFFLVFRLSFRFGEHGLMKYFAKRGLPSRIVFRSRRVFTALKYGGVAHLESVKSVKSIKSTKVVNGAGRIGGRSGVNPKSVW